MAISFFTVPIVLHALGEKDFGLFNLIAGIIAMLAFMNGAMTVSTQRYLSVTIGERDNNKLLQVYNLSILLHIIIGIAVAIVVESLMPLLFNHVLNIEPSQYRVAHLLFHTLVATMFINIVTVPFDAVINAYENLLFFSITGVIEALLKLALVLSLSLFATNSLIIYAVSLTAIAAFILLVKYVYCHIKYKKLHLSFIACRNKPLFVEMTKFTGWNTLSSFALVARNQGLAMVLNYFLGTIINAAYGIAMQVSSVLGYFTETVKKSINPQLMESEGLHEHHRLVELTFALTKYSLLILCFITIPLFIEMPYIIKIWIGNTPNYTVEFTRIIIVLALMTQASSGLMSAVQSSGKIKWYTITICLTLLSTLVFVFMGLYRHGSPVAVLSITCAIEIVAFFIRLWYAHRLNSIPAWSYVFRLIFPITMLTIITGLLMYGCKMILSPSLLRLSIICTIDILFFLPITYFLILNRSDREYVKLLVRKLSHRLKK